MVRKQPLEYEVILGKPVMYLDQSKEIELEEEEKRWHVIATYHDVKDDVSDRFPKFLGHIFARC